MRRGTPARGGSPGHEPGALAALVRRTTETILLTAAAGIVAIILVSARWNVGGRAVDDTTRPRAGTGAAIAATELTIRTFSVRADQVTGLETVLEKLRSGLPESAGSGQPPQEAVLALLALRRRSGQDLVDIQVLDPRASLTGDHVMDVIRDWFLEHGVVIDEVIGRGIAPERSRGAGTPR